MGCFDVLFVIRMMQKGPSQAPILIIYAFSQSCRRRLIEVSPR